MKINSIVRIVILSVLAVAAIVLMFFAYSKYSAKRCRGIEVKIENNEEQYLISKNDVENWVTLNKNEPFEGKIIENINLALVEKRVLNSGYVQKCEAYTDLQGKLIIEVSIYQPLARILGNNGKPDRFLDKTGVIFPFSKHFSPNVLLISGTFFDAIQSIKNKKNADLLLFVNTINNDEFWKAQIAQLDINNEGEIQLMPVLGRQMIEFGKPEKINSKLNKLLVFYKQIMPVNEWSKFSKISVKFDGQIVCN